MFIWGIGFDGDLHIIYWALYNEGTLGELESLNRGICNWNFKYLIYKRVRGCQGFDTGERECDNTLGGILESAGLSTLGANTSEVSLLV